MLFVSEDSATKVIKLTIIGAGPVGLAFMVELLNKARAQINVSFEINVIEKRDLNFNRGQKIIMIQDESENAGLSWIDFIKRQFFPGQDLTLSAQGDLLIDGAIPEQQSSRYAFLRKILRQKEKPENPVNVSIKQLQTNLLEQIKENLPQNVIINWHLNSTVTQINLTTSTLTISSATDSKEIGFHALINCEGEKRQTVAIINKEARRAPTPISSFQYQELESIETYHMAIKIKIKIKIKKPESKTYNALINIEKEKYRKDQKKQQEVDSFVKSLVSINGHKQAIADLPFLFDPNTYKQEFYTDHWVPKYFVAGLIPREIHLIENPQEKRELLLKWASYLLAYNYNLAPENFIIDTKNDSEKMLQQRANTFSSKIMAVNDPIMVLPNKSVIVLLGDACMSPYYWEGISSTIGLNEALSFLECVFDEGSPAVDPYQKIRATYEQYKTFVTECLADNALDTPKSHSILHHL